MYICSCEIFDLVVNTLNDFCLKVHPLTFKVDDLLSHVINVKTEYQPELKIVNSVYHSTTFYSLKHSELKVYFKISKKMEYA